MSIALGGLSATISRVSLRACALASDQMAGAAVAAAPAGAVLLKNVRRLMEGPLISRIISELPQRSRTQGACQRPRAHGGCFYGAACLQPHHDRASRSRPPRTA